MERRIGLVLVIINLLMALVATNFFLRGQKLSVIQWLAVNTCTPSIVIFVVGYFLNNTWLMGFSAIWMLFYGGGGLVIFRWSTNPQDIIPQIGHIFMVAAVIYIIYSAAINHEIKKLLIGAIVGLITLVPAFYAQQKYHKKHPELVKLLGFKDG